MKKKLELLAPAGDLKRLKYALAYGADAVYLGLPDFSLRAKTDFSLADLATGVKYAHARGKKVFVTINIFAHNRHLKILPAHLKALAKIRPDAIILSDPGVMQMVKKFLPQTPVHLSTQMNTLNYEAVKFWQKQGVTRIILGREASLADIKEIHRQAPKMELEVFVQGAMCLSYSGRCYLSAWFNERSANLGECTQSCRWKYRVYLEEPLRPGVMLPVETNDCGTYIMNSKDLCLIEYLADLARAGVSSCKIEGRTKSVYYVSVATKACRQAIDRIGKTGHAPSLQALKEELAKIDNRGYTTGFLLGKENDTRQNIQSSKAKSDWQIVGEVIESRKSIKSKVHKVKGKKIFETGVYFRAHNTLLTKKLVEIITPKDRYAIKIKDLQSSRGEKITEAHGGTKEIFHFNLTGDYDILETGLIRQKI